MSIDGTTTGRWTTNDSLLELKRSKRKYDFLVFIARVQPLHNGHKAVIDRALSLASKVIVFVGSASAARTFHRNPFTYEERKRMLDLEYPTDRVIVKPMNDHTYNDQAWIEQVQYMTKEVIKEFPGNTENVTLHGLNDFRIGLIGCNKDASSFYLKMFPQWGSEEVGMVTNTSPINATDIREAYFTMEFDFFRSYTQSDIPASVAAFLKSFKETYNYQNLNTERIIIQAYKDAWKDAPYPPTHLTVDAVVIQSGHVLLVERGAHPGLGMWALPGGFVEEYERIDDAVIRELKEETKIKVPIPVLKGSIVTKRVFDDPFRSSRGRTVTHAYLIHLRAETDLPKVKGSDDAVQAEWVHLADIQENQMCEDHYHIIQNMVREL